MRTNEKADIDVPETLIKRGKLFSYKNVYYYIFLKSGFTKGCIDKANEHGNVSLVSLEDIINDINIKNQE